MDWQRSDTLEGNGYFWESADGGVSAFEDTSDGSSRWYAWVGTPDDHDDAGHGRTADTRDEAVASVLAIIDGSEQP